MRSLIAKIDQTPRLRGISCWCDCTWIWQWLEEQVNGHSTASKCDEVRWRLVCEIDHELSGLLVCPCGSFLCCLTRTWSRPLTSLTNMLRCPTRFRLVWCILSHLAPPIECILVVCLIASHRLGLIWLWNVFLSPWNSTLYFSVALQLGICLPQPRRGKP